MGCILLPPAGSAVPKVFKQGYLFIKIISCSLLFSLQDCTFFYFLLGNWNCLDQRNMSKKTYCFLTCSESWTEKQLQITCADKERRLALLSQLSCLCITGRENVLEDMERRFILHRNPTSFYKE